MRIKLDIELLHLQHEDYNKRLSAGLVFCEGYAPIKKDGLWGFINEQGREVVPCKYEEVKFFKKGYAPVCKDKLWGFTNEQGEEVIPCKYVDDYLNHLPHMYFKYKRIKNTRLREKALSLLVKD